MVQFETLSSNNFSAQMQSSDNEYLINVMNKHSSVQYKVHKVNKHIIVKGYLKVGFLLSSDEIKKEKDNKISDYTL